MKKTLLSLSLMMLFTNTAVAEIESEFSGSIAFETRYFTDEPLYPQQLSQQNFIELKPQYFLSLGENTQFNFEGFARYSDKDTDSNYTDIREMMLYYYMGDFEFNIGIGKVFWGQAESINLVNIINQTDYLASFDNEEKLGQQMIGIRYLLNSGSISFYALPDFNVVDFPSLEGRMRTPILIDNDKVFYEEVDQENEMQYAVRYQQSFENLDLGLSYFEGTSRLPELVMTFNSNGYLIFAPKYNLLTQYGIDLLYLMDDIALKFEGIQVQTTKGDYLAYVGGFEYTYYGIFDTNYNLGLIMEYQSDERKDDPMILGQNDLMVGARFEFNDFDSSEILVGYTMDLDYSGSYSFYIEASRRINENFKVSLNAYLFNSELPTDPIFLFRHDDHIDLNIEYYF